MFSDELIALMKERDRARIDAVRFKEEDDWLMLTITQKSRKQYHKRRKEGSFQILHWKLKNDKEMGEVIQGNSS